MAPDFCIVVVPERRPPPDRTQAREDLCSAGSPGIVITDDVTSQKDQFAALKESDFGFTSHGEADAMIGARREFLEPIEDGGLQREPSSGSPSPRVPQDAAGARQGDRPGEAGKEGRKDLCFRSRHDLDKAVDGEFSQNPYARPKARAATRFAQAAACRSNVKRLLMRRSGETVSRSSRAPNEMMRQAMILCGEGRDLEKGMPTRS